MTARTYCGSDVHEHDPVYVFEEADGEHVEAGAFCSDASLFARVGDADLMAGAACEIDR